MLPTGTENLLKIAQVLKSNGTDGEILLGLRDILPEDIDREEPVFIVFDGLPVPFFILSLSARGRNRALVRLNDIRTLEDAEEVVGRPVYVSADTYSLEDDGPASLVGWTLEDAAGNPCGTISDYEDIPGNTCLYVARPDGSTALVPLHEDLVIAMDGEARVLRMEIPQGLL